jgi:hypothetical protein
VLAVTVSHVVLHTVPLWICAPYEISAAVSRMKSVACPI